MIKYKEVAAKKLEIIHPGHYRTNLVSDTQPTPHQKELSDKGDILLVSLKPPNQNSFTDLELDDLFASSVKSSLSSAVNGTTCGGNA